VSCPFNHQNNDSRICSGHKWQPVGSSAVVAHPPQSCACCGFTNAWLHTWVVKNGYVSQSCSSISLNQSVYSPLTYSINKAFSPTGLLHTRCFSLFTPFFVNPRNGCAKKNPSNWADCEILKPIWHQQPCHAQNCLNHLSHYDIQFGVQEIVLTRTTPLNALKQLPCYLLIR